ncbi:MAG TPA: TIGR04053 family radical SAM/SPASM domain-containing protein [Candidatus Binatia bacterium]|nr:TIGR04053 family radical SAM/SPASM domain-containing protein [Candidatus Binatia bacterium]
MTAYRFEAAPVRVYWELTRACDLACRHCRAEAIRQRAPDELTTAEAVRVLRALAAATPRPHVVLTGGDPLKRPDLRQLVERAAELGLRPSVAPSATVALDRTVVEDLKRAGVAAMSLSLDGPRAAQHDAIRGVLGCFGWTLAAAQRIVNAGIPLQINTLLCAETDPYLEDTAALVARLGASRWSLFFLVPVGRGRALRPLDARDCELRLRWLAAAAEAWPFTVTTTEAPHYRRVLIQRLRARGQPALTGPHARSFGLRDGNGIMFIAADGAVTPSGFLPLAAGNARRSDPLRLYREARLFRTLRDPDRFGGRCGVCEYRAVCGGSRARAWATSGQVTGEDPLCAWQPR